MAAPGLVALLQVDRQRLGWGDRRGELAEGAKTMSVMSDEDRERGREEKGGGQDSRGERSHLCLCRTLSKVIKRDSTTGHSAFQQVEMETGREMG